MTTPKVVRYADAAAVALGAATAIADLAARAISSRGRFVMALSGGGTPELLYRTLAATPFSTIIDWSRVHVCWCDERPVPPDHPKSNYRMAAEALLDRVPIPPSQVYRIRGEIDAETAAAEYLRTLRRVLPHRRLDLVLLGLGKDGHTASLFPGTRSVEQATAGSTEWVAAPWVPSLETRRVTMMPALLNSADTVFFLVTGAGKAGILERILGGTETGLPAQLIRPTHGTLTWLIDAAAATHAGDQV